MLILSCLSIVGPDSETLVNHRVFHSNLVRYHFEYHLKCTQTRTPQYNNIILLVLSQEPPCYDGAFHCVYLVMVEAAAVQDTDNQDTVLDTSS